MALSKTGRFLSQAELLGVGVSSPLPTKLAVDTRTAVWVPTAEKIVLRETRTCSRKFGVASAPALYKNLDVNVVCAFV